MMKYFAVHDAQGVIQMGFEQEVPEVGPPLRIPVVDGFNIAELDEPFVRSDPSPTAIPRLSGRAVAWEETAQLSQLIELVLAKTYVDVDRVHQDAVGSRATEYQEAEAAARMFAAGGYQGVADIDVHGFALHNPTGLVQTDEWAAVQIIARADAFRSAQKAMRNSRFQRQAEMRAASTVEDLRSVQALWDQFIFDLRAQLGLPPA